MGTLKAGEYGVKVYAGRVTSAIGVASTLANDYNAELAITATATAAKSLTAGVRELTVILQKIQGDLSDIENSLMNTNRSLGDTNARIRSNQAALSAVPRDTFNILNDEEAQAKIDKTNKDNASKRTDINKKISNDQTTVTTLNAKISELNSKKWSFSVLANRILQSIVKINATHDTLLPVRDKLVAYHETSGYGYIKFTFLAQQSQTAFESLWGNLNSMDNESRFNIYNASIANILNDKMGNGQEIQEHESVIRVIGATIKAQREAGVAKYLADEKELHDGILENAKKYWDDYDKWQVENNEKGKEYMLGMGAVAAGIVALPLLFGGGAAVATTEASAELTAATAEVEAIAAPATMAIEADAALTAALPAMQAEAAAAAAAELAAAEAPGAYIAAEAAYSSAQSALSVAQMEGVGVAAAEANVATAKAALDAAGAFLESVLPGLL